MSYLPQILRHCDIGKSMKDSKTRFGWVNLWKDTICQLQSTEIFIESSDEDTLPLTRILSRNQYLLVEQILRLQEEGKREIDKLHRSLDKLQLEEMTDNQESELPINGQQDLKFDMADLGQNRLPLSNRSCETDVQLRDWYLSNITLPFPDSSAKRNLTALTGLDIRQLNTWFTNMRRRSGYTDLMRKYADGGKELFKKLCQQADRGEGPKGLSEALHEMRRYVGRKPKGEVEDRLVNIIEKHHREEDVRPSKRARIAEAAEHTIAKPQTIARATPEEKPSVSPLTASEPDSAGLSDSAVAESTSIASEMPATDAVESTPPEPKSARSPQKKIKVYTFSTGASDETHAKTPSKRCPTAPSRPSPLRTVSITSNDSANAVDSSLRTVSGSSCTASNISSDLNFTFPTFQQATSPMQPELVRMPSFDTTQKHTPRDSASHSESHAAPQYQQPSHIFHFGHPEMSQFVFNPNLSHTIQLPPYSLTIPYPAFQQPLLYPTIQHILPALPPNGFQQSKTFQQSVMHFDQDVETLKRRFEAIGGREDERTAKAARFEAL